MRTLDAWTAARSIQDAARDASEAAYAAYWMLSMGTDDAYTHRDRVRREAGKIASLLAALNDALAEQPQTEEA